MLSAQKIFYHIFPRFHGVKKVIKLLERTIDGELYTKVVHSHHYSSLLIEMSDASD